MNGHDKIWPQAVWGRYQRRAGQLLMWHDHTQLLQTALIAAALAATILFELHGQYQESEATTPFPALLLPTPTADHPATPDVRQIARWATTSIARPLFDQARRPAGGTPPVSPVVPSLPRMAGVWITPSGRWALFAGKSGEKSLVVSEGSQVGAFTIQSIQAGEVTVRNSEGERVLKPAFDQDATALAQSATPPTEMWRLPRLMVD